MLLAGHHVVACDWKENEHMTVDMFCDEFHLVDLRLFDNCLKVIQGCDHVFNFAADMGATYTTVLLRGGH
jgi:GDP-D-mannose 3', 5'-epimerase